MTTQALLARRSELIAAAKQLIEAPGELTEDRLNKYTQAEAEIARINTLLGSAATLGALEANAHAANMQAQQSAMGGSLSTFLGGFSPQVAGDPGRAFKGFGEFMAAVTAAYSGGARDPRLLMPLAAGPLGQNVGNPSDGGFLVQKDYSLSMFRLMHEQGRLLSRIRRIPISANADGIKLPIIDETSRADGARWGGVRAYWVAEAGTVNPSTIKVGQMELGLHKMMALGYVTSELLRDAAVMDSLLMDAFREELTFIVEKSIMWGTGSGQPLGFMRSPALITVSKENSQTNLTVTTQNIIDMWTRLSMRSKASAVWFVSHEVEPKLYTLTIGTGAAAALIYQPPGMAPSSANTPYGTLFGRPVIPIEHAMPIGYTGDIILADLSDYLMTNKEEVQEASSMHVQFLTDQMVHRLTYRTDGQPATRKPLTPANGSTTTSPYVALEDRHA